MTQNYSQMFSDADLPQILLMAGFTLTVKAYTDCGTVDPTREQVTGVCGTARLRLDCAEPPDLSRESLTPSVPSQLYQDYEVVTQVVYPQTQIDLDSACLIQPDIQPGETLRVEKPVSDVDVNKLLQAPQGLIDGVTVSREPGEIPVEFHDMTIEAVPGKEGVGSVTEGEAVYSPQLGLAHLSVGGFVLRVNALVLTLRQATADLSLQLPRSLAAADSCGPAQLDLGKLDITPDCQIMIESLRGTFGPWIVGDTGMIVEGTGYLLDLSAEESPAEHHRDWKGLKLHSGKASGQGLVPAGSNTSYLAADYEFDDAIVIADGFHGEFRLSGSNAFRTFQPAGFVIQFDGGHLRVSGSRIVSGALGPGRVLVPTTVACQGAVGGQLSLEYSQLEVRDDLDLAGPLEATPGVDISWGELTRPGSAVLAWTMKVLRGFLYLPAGPIATFDPEVGGEVPDLALPDDAAACQAEIKAKGMAGITFDKMEDLRAHSPDRPGGPGDPLLFEHPQGWLLLGSMGASGRIELAESYTTVYLGNPNRTGYVGVDAFAMTFFPDWKRVCVAQFVDSAVYDSQLYGFLILPPPGDIPQLEFLDMGLTATACLIGGKVSLSGNVKLGHWGLDLESTSSTQEAGVVSIRTGQLFFTAAAIGEPVHFEKPFNLIWGEMLANGSLGELVFDHNCFGQRFDNFPFTLFHIALSPYVAGATDAYLAVCGTVHFRHFGPSFVNIQDALYNDTNAPYKGRYVTIPKTGGAACHVTDLGLELSWTGAWNEGPATFEFPDDMVGYHEEAQNGFLGRGSALLGFMLTDRLVASIEIHHDAVDICLMSSDSNNLDLGLISRLGSISGIYGCARIEGWLLRRISMFAYLDQAAAVGTDLLYPKAGYMVEVSMNITSTSFDFAAAGDLILTAAGAAIDISASLHLSVDWNRGSAEGEIQGRIDCNSFVLGLAGEGQVTWYVGADSQYLQGKLAMTICGWSSGGELEGGLFVGHDAPRDRAWVLYEGGERFGISDNILPARLTGAYGYGQLSFSSNWFLFSGGVEILLGAGLFLPEATVFGRCGVRVYGEILGGLISVGVTASLALRGPYPLYFEGSFELGGCILWFLCTSFEVTAGLNSDGFYLY